MVLPVAATAVDLQRLVGHGGEHGHRVHLRHGRLHRGVLGSALAAAGGVQDQLPGRLDLGGVLREHELDRLPLGQLLAEGDPPARVLQREPLGPLGQTDAAHRDGDARGRQEAPEEDLQTVALGADAVVHRDRRAVEREGRVVRARHAHGLRGVLRVDTGGVPRHQQRHRPVPAGAARHAGRQEVVVAAHPEGDQVLAARQVVRVALAGHGGGDVGAGAVVRLGQGEGDLQFAVDRGNDEPLALVVGGVAVQAAPDPVAHVHDHADRAVGAGEDLHQLHPPGEAEAEAAVLPWRGHAQEAVVVQLGPQLLGDRAGGLDAFRPAFARPFHPALDPLVQSGEVHVPAHAPPTFSCSVSTRRPRCGARLRARSRSTNFCTLPAALRGRLSTTSSRSGQ